MSKEVKKTVRKRKPAKPVDHTEEGVKVSVVKRDNYSKTEELIKGEAIESDDSMELNDVVPKEKEATVGLSKGYSFNMGNFESARINCWISVPCKNDDTEIMDTFARVSELLDEQIEFEANELDSEE